MLTDGSLHTADAVANGGGFSSPQSRRRSLHSPWASVVRGDSEQNSSPTAAAVASSGGVSPGFSSSPPVEEASAPENFLIESSTSEPQPESSENNGHSNAGGPRRPAWNRPQNGVVEPVSVMGGAVSWPALSETTRPVPRSFSNTSRPVSDGSTSSSQAPIISQPPHRSTNNSSAHGNHGSGAGNNPNPARPRSRNRGGSGGGGVSSSGSGPSQSTFNPPSLQTPPPFPVFDLTYAIMPPVPRPIGGVGTSQSHSNDHSSQRSNSRRGNYGPRPRGDGQYHGRRDQDRRDFHHQYVPSPMPIGHMAYRPPPPPLVNPFLTPLPPISVFPGFDMSSSFLYAPPMMPESFSTMSISPPPMIFAHAIDNSLTNMIVKQIDFYFSDDNLVRDIFLRSNMDDHGWVPISLIASFRRVQQLTSDITLILESLRHSDVVEVNVDNVRRRNDWNKWILVSSDPSSSFSFSAFENVQPSQTVVSNGDKAEE